MLNKIHFFFSIFLLCTACTSVEIFNEEKPYTLLLGRYRYVEEVKSVQYQLESIGIQSFVYSENNDDSGRWFSVFSGAYASKNKINSIKKDLEERYYFKNIEVINYNTVNDFEKIDLEKYQKQYLSKRRFKLHDSPFDQIPLIAGFRFQDINYIKFQEGFDVLKTNSVKVMRPRHWLGTSFKELAPSLVSFTEVNYENCLTKEVFKLTILERKNQKQNVVELLKKNIWKGREKTATKVLIEESEFGFDLSSENHFENVEFARIWQNEKYTFVLSDIHSPKQMINDWNLVSQSRRNFTESDLLNNINLMSSYSESDIFMIDISYLKSKRKESHVLEGSYEVKYAFHDIRKGTWESKFNFLNANESAQEVFTNVYLKEDVNAVYETLDTSFGTAQLKYIKEVVPQSGSYKLKANNLQFVINNIVGEVSNKKKALLTKEELLMIYHLYFNPLQAEEL